MNIQQLIQQTEDKIKAYELEVSTPIIQHANTIVEFGCYTVMRDNETSLAKLVTVQFPTCFSEKTANDLVANMVVRNDNGERITGKAYFWKDWYKARLSELRETLRLLKTIPQ